MGYKNEHDDYGIEDFEVTVSELAVATASSCDDLIDPSVRQVLQSLRTHLRMDVAFVAEFVDGRRVFRRVEASADADVIREGDDDLLERTFCQRVVDGRLPGLLHDASRHPAVAAIAPPFPVRAFLSTPIVLGDGSIYGTLCCFSFAVNERLTRHDLRRLRMAAALIGRQLDEARRRQTEQVIETWSLEPVVAYRRRH